MDILIHISNHFNLRDFIRMKAVSKSWAIDVKCPERCLNLMSFDALQCLCNMSTPEGQFFTITHAAFHGKSHVGTSHGWMIMLSSDHSLSVLNPLSGTIIDLPLPQDIKSYQLNASTCRCLAALSAPPTSPEYVLLVLLLFAPVVLYCRPGDENWRSFTYNPNIIAGEGLHIIRRVFHCMGKFYTLTWEGRAFTIDCIAEEVKDFQLPLPIIHYYPECKNRCYPGCLNYERYLVEADGEVLCVITIIMHALLIGPQIFQWDPCALTWSRVYDLGGRAMFLGQGGSLVVDGMEELYGFVFDDRVLVFGFVGRLMSRHPSVPLSIPRETHRTFGWIMHHRLASS